MTRHNLLLAGLPGEVYDKIEPHLEPLSLPRNKVLHSPGETIRDLYFPISCLISVTITMRGGQTAESGAIGNRR